MAEGCWRGPGTDLSYYTVGNSPRGNVLYAADVHGRWWWRAAVFGDDGMVAVESSHDNIFWAMRWVEDKVRRT